LRRRGIGDHASATTTMPSFVRIALLFNLAPGYFEGVLRGISAYARPDKPWLFQLMDVRNLAPVREYAPQGVITSLGDQATSDAVRALRLPTVNVGAYDFAPEVPHVGNDDALIGQLGARHFLDRGFTRFAFFNPVAAPFASRREAGFRRALAAAGHACDRHLGQDPDRWLRALPRQTAIFTANDHGGAMLAERCRELGLRVPEDLALLGVDNVETLCALTYPPLSSVVVGAERIGFEAARMLESLLAGRRIRQGLSVPPQGVATRHSSDLVAVADAHVAAAVRFIAAHAGQAIRVEDVLRAVPVARRTLETRCRALLGRSLLDEIRRVRVERARHLLATTDWAMPLIATASGFSDAKHLATVFGALAGITPLRFRRRIRPGGASADDPGKRG
jgi:LacI family transcriptional regulator